MPQIDAATRFRQYQVLPKCKGKTAEQICQMMIAENKLNHQEYLNLKQNSLIFLFGTINGRNNSEDTDWHKLTGVKPNAEAQTKKMDRVQASMVVNRQYHWQASFIEVNSKGKPDMSQFTFEGLKQRYDSKKYDVMKGKDGSIAVITKNGSLTFSVTKLPTGAIYVTNIMGPKVETAKITEKGKICDYSISETTFGKKKTTRYYDGTLTPKVIQEIYPNGDRKNTVYKKNSSIEFEDYWKKDANMASWAKEYTNGILWKTSKIVKEGQKVEYPLVNELVKDVTAARTIGHITQPRLKTDILKGIDENNISEIWDKFEEQTGKNIIEFLRNKHTIASKVKTQCINHIEKLFIQHYHDKEKVGKLLAKRLYQDINGTNYSELNNYIKLLDKNNLKYVMVEYRNIAGRKHNIEQNEFNNTMEIVRRYLPEPLCTYTAENIIKKATPFRGLLESIATSNLSLAKKKEFIKYITDTAMEDKNGIAVRNAKKDIASHPNDMHKVEIDIYRLQNTKSGDMRNPNIGETVSDKTSREFLGTTRKQGQVGDCWLLAGLNSIIGKPKMLAKLNELVSYNDKTGKYTITMKGAKKKYVVTSQEIAEANHLSSGSLKTRAVEIAMDRYIKELAYSHKEVSFLIDPNAKNVANVDLNGGYAHNIWYALWGWGKDNSTNKKPDIAKEDFNYPNRAYTFSLCGKDNIYGMAKSEKDPNYRIISRHEYSIIGSDQKNVYALNPWDSDDVITISRADLAQMNVNIEQYEIPQG